MLLEILVYSILWLIALTIPLAILILSLIAFFRTRRIAPLEQRIGQLEMLLRQRTDQAAGPFREPEGPELTAARESAAQVSAAQVVEPLEPERPAAVRRPIQWEYLIGQKAFGWAAVALAVFATSFRDLSHHCVFRVSRISRHRGSSLPAHAIQPRC